MLRLAILIYWATPVVLLLCLISLLLTNSLFSIFRLVGFQFSWRCIEILRVLHAAVVVGGTAVAVAFWASYCNAEFSPTLLVEVYLDATTCFPASTLASLALLALLFADRAAMQFLQYEPLTLLQRVARASLVASTFVALSAEDGTVGLPLAVLAMGRVVDALASFFPRACTWARCGMVVYSVGLASLVLMDAHDRAPRKTAAITLFASVLY